MAAAAAYNAASSRLPSTSIPASSNSGTMPGHIWAPHSPGSIQKTQNSADGIGCLQAAGASVLDFTIAVTYFMTAIGARIQKYAEAPASRSALDAGPPSGGRPVPTANQGPVDRGPRLLLRVARRTTRP